jgi:hypothetical protein
MSRLSPAALAAFCVATMDDKDRAAIEKMNATDAREDQLVAAHDEWKEARRVAKDRSGETAAEEWAEQLFNEKYDACDRVACYRARTLAGILAKLAFIAGDSMPRKSFRQRWERQKKYFSASRWTSRR